MGIRQAILIAAFAVEICAQSPQQAQFCAAMQAYGKRYDKLGVQAGELRGTGVNPIDKRRREAEVEQLEAQIKPMPDEFRRTTASILGPAMEIRDWVGTLEIFGDAGHNTIWVMVALRCNDPYPMEKTSGQMNSLGNWYDWINVQLVTSSQPPPRLPLRPTKMIEDMQRQSALDSAYKYFPINSPLVQSISRLQVGDPVRISGHIVVRSAITTGSPRDNKGGFKEDWDVLPASIVLDRGSSVTPYLGLLPLRTSEVVNPDTARPGQLFRANLTNGIGTDGRGTSLREDSVFFFELIRDTSPGARNHAVVWLARVTAVEVDGKRRPVVATPTPIAQMIAASPPFPMGTQFNAQLEQPLQLRDNAGAAPSQAITKARSGSARLGRVVVELHDPIDTTGLSRTAETAYWGRLAEPVRDLNNLDELVLPAGLPVQIMVSSWQESAQSSIDWLFNLSRIRVNGRDMDLNRVVNKQDLSAFRKAAATLPSGRGARQMTPGASATMPPAGRSSTLLNYLLPKGTKLTFENGGTVMIP